MSWLAPWLKQSVSWEAFTGGDDWEGRQYPTTRTISARKEEARNEAFAATGPEVRQAYTIWVNPAEADVKVGDRIDGEVVVARNSLVDLDGRLVGYELRTEG